MEIPDAIIKNKFINILQSNSSYALDENTKMNQSLRICRKIIGEDFYVL